MQRSSYLVLMLIMLVAGVTIGTVIEQPTRHSVTLGQAAKAETAFAFYRALGRAVSGEGTESLEALLADTFQQHEGGIGEALTAEIVLDRVREQALASRAVRYEVETVEASGNYLVACWVVRSAVVPQVVGMPFEPTRPERSCDVFRVTQDGIIDRWTSSSSWLQAVSLENVEIKTSGTAGVAIILNRVSIPSSAEFVWSPGPQGVLLIESGLARVSMLPIDGEGVLDELEAGMAMATPAAAKLRIEAISTEPVRALIYLLRTISPTGVMVGGAASGEQAPGVVQSLLWQGHILGEPTAKVHRVGRIELPPKLALDLRPDRGTMLLMVASGDLEIAHPGGTVATLGTDYWPMEQDNYARIDTGSAAFIDATGGTVGIRNPGAQPVTIFLISIASEANQPAAAQES